MNETHLDLFTGLGGFTCAAHTAGFRTVGMCEADARCRAFLAAAWPQIPCWPDVRKLDGRQYRGVTLLTAGVPCQPASRAGKQRGKDDDRWLWGETLRIVDEAKPRVALFENPAGIEDLAEFGIQPPVEMREFAVGNNGEVTHRACAVGQLGDGFQRSGIGCLHSILGDVEAMGYEIGPIFDIPACAVNAPHRRQRLWITAWRTEQLADAEEKRLGRRASTKRRCSGASPQDGGLHSEGVDNTAEARHDGKVGRAERDSRNEARVCLFGPRPEAWSDFIWLPCADGKIRRAIGDTQRMAHGLPVELLEALAEGESPQSRQPHRSIIGALGNSIVPQVAVEILNAIRGACET